jgi:hypothetical protein
MSAMMNALTDLDKYQATHGSGGGALTTSQLLQIADFSDDGVVTNADMQGLINYLAAGGGAGNGALSAVPEPSSVALGASAIIWVIACVARRRPRM